MPVRNLGSPRAPHEFLPVSFHFARRRRHVGVSAPSATHEGQHPEHMCCANSVSCDNESPLIRAPMRNSTYIPHLMKLSRYVAIYHSECNLQSLGILVRIHSATTRHLVCIDTTNLSLVPPQHLVCVGCAYLTLAMCMYCALLLLARYDNTIR